MTSTANKTTSAPIHSLGPARERGRPEAWAVGAERADLAQVGSRVGGFCRGIRVRDSVGAHALREEQCQPATLCELSRSQVGAGQVREGLADRGRAGLSNRLDLGARIGGDDPKCLPEAPSTGREIGDVDPVGAEALGRLDPSTCDLGCVGRDPRGRRHRVCGGRLRAARAARGDGERCREDDQRRPGHASPMLPG